MINDLHIFYMSNNISNFQMYKFLNIFFIRFLLENGLAQIEKILEIDESFFFHVLENPNDFDFYSLANINNTNRLKIIYNAAENFNLYKIDNYYFMETWLKKELPLKLERKAKGIPYEEFLKYINK